MGILAIVLLFILHLPLATMDNAPFASAAFHEILMLPFNSWVFFAYLLPVAVVRVAGYETRHIFLHPLALALIGLPLAACIFLPFETRDWILYFLLPFYALAVETLAQGEKERSAGTEALAAQPETADSHLAS